MDRGTDGLRTGKNAVLRVLTAQLGGPGPKPHSAVQAAFDASRDWFTQWRLRYNLPPNDPRYLEITEAEVLQDMLTIHFHRKWMTRELDGISEALEDLEDLALDQDRVDAFQQAGEEYAQSGSTQRAIQRATKGGTPEELEAKRLPKTIKIGGRASTTPIVKP